MNIIVIRKPFKVKNDKPMILTKKIMLKCGVGTFGLSITLWMIDQREFTCDVEELKKMFSKSRDNL